MKKIAYVGGTFDLFHPGHVRFLQQIARVTELPVMVALNTDEFAARYKRKPILTLEERTELVHSCRYVDYTITNKGDEDSTVTIEGLMRRNFFTKFICHGDDWPVEDLKRQMGVTDEWLIRNDIGMLSVPYAKGISSTDIEHRVNMRINTGMAERLKAYSAQACCGDPGDCRC